MGLILRNVAVLFALSALALLYFCEIPSLSGIQEDAEEIKNKKPEEINEDNNNNNKNKKPIILIGTHHKTGVVLNSGLFRKVAKFANLKFERFNNTSIERSKLAERMKDVDIVVARKWQWVEEDLKAMGRPYKFVHFTRHPIDIISSGYSYHLKRSEQWLYENEGYVREDWCGGEKPAKETVKRCKKYGKQLPFVCSKEGQDAFENLLCHEYDLTKDMEQSTNTSWIGNHYDALKRRNRLDGVRLEAARIRGLQQQLDMAAVVAGTKNDPNVLNVNLDTVGANHKGCWEKIFSFVGLDPKEYMKLTNWFAIENKSGTHITRRENKTDIKQELRTNPYIQNAYGPLIRIIEEAQPELSCN